MRRNFSPLRYPGGKTSMMHLAASILRENGLERRPYAEPFAGGCGLALGLLFHSHVSEIFINDIDPSIWSFWYSVLNNTEEFVREVLCTEVTIEEWSRQREIYLAQDLGSPLELGFAAFFLNRTNRSGIIKGAGVIGGVAQTGNYKIDCRFNKEDLVRRIRRVAKYKSRIHLSRQDALDFVRSASSFLPEKSLLCIDPPYFNKGSSLYTSHYVADDHALLADAIHQLERPWIVTYDDVEEIRRLYDRWNRYSFDVNYSVQTKRKSTELLVASTGLVIAPAVEHRLIA